MIDLHNTECLAHMRTMPDNSVDAIVTDPPYGLSFMGKRWDYDVPSVEVWEECLRVLKPGGHLLAFAGTRTQHRMAVRIEDAGFEIRDMIAWVYGSGFPKSLDVSKAIDKAAGAERPVVGMKVYGEGAVHHGGANSGRRGGVMSKSADRGPNQITAPATQAAQQWAGYGTALKPALEPITMARKPLIGTVAENVLEHGTGALNIDGCRVPGTGEDLGGGRERSDNHKKTHEGWLRPWMDDPAACNAYTQRAKAQIAHAEAMGRWPANLIHDGSDEVVGLFPEARSSGVFNAQNHGTNPECSATNFGKRGIPATMYADYGSAARFFYCAKASKADRDEGCEGLEEIRRGVGDTRPSGDFGERLGPRADGSERKAPVGRNHHPTVKPTDLMRYLCRLVTPPGGTILDPFMGSGSTGKAAKLEGFNFIGIEREADYVAIAQARIDGAKINAKHYANASRHAQQAVKQPTLFDAPSK
jgi:site-specific DNA-methyltransferase (adenine-specific)